MLIPIFIPFIATLSTISAYELSFEFENCLLKNGIQFKILLDDLHQCVNNQMNSLVESLTVKEEFNDTKIQLQNNIMHCLVSFGIQVQDCISREVTDELLKYQIQTRKIRATNNTENISMCAFDPDNVGPKIMNCTADMAVKLALDCNLGMTDFLWQPIKEDEDVEKYCKREGDKSRCIVSKLHECYDKSAREMYRKYFFCIYSSDTTCKKKIKKSYIHLLPDEEQPKPPWLGRSIATKVILDFNIVVIILSYFVVYT